MVEQHPELDKTGKIRAVWNQKTWNLLPGLAKIPGFAISAPYGFLREKFGDKRDTSLNLNSYITPTLPEHLEKIFGEKADPNEINKLAQELTQDTAFGYKFKNMPSRLWLDFSFGYIIWQFCYSTYRAWAHIPGWETQILEAQSAISDPEKPEQNLIEPAGQVMYQTNEDGLLDIIFAFRGTQSIDEIAKDAESGGHPIVIPSFLGVELKQQTYAWGPGSRFVDEVFLDGLSTAVEILRNSPEKINSIIITGHSLGGGVAECFAAIVSQTIPSILLPRIRLVTFEGMRGLTSETLRSILDTEQKVIDETAIRIYNSKDWVPHVPFFWWGYRHLGQQGIAIDDTLMQGFSSALGDQFNVKIGPHSMHPFSLMMTEALLFLLSEEITADLLKSYNKITDKTEEDKEQIKQLQQREDEYSKIIKSSLHFTSGRGMERASKRRRIN